jgi:hypothetical protein
MSELDVPYFPEDFVWACPRGDVNEKGLGFYDRPERGPSPSLRPRSRIAMRSVLGQVLAAAGWALWRQA